MSGVMNGVFPHTAERGLPRSLLQVGRHFRFGHAGDSTCGGFRCFCVVSSIFPFANAVSHACYSFITGVPQVRTPKLNDILIVGYPAKEPQIIRTSSRRCSLRLHTKRLLQAHIVPRVEFRRPWLLEPCWARSWKTGYFRSCGIA